MILTDMKMNLLVSGVLYVPRYKAVNIPNLESGTASVGDSKLQLLFAIGEHAGTQEAVFYMSIDC